MIGSMAEQLLVTNRKKMTMELMQSRLENIMKSKVMKKTNKLTSTKIKKMYSRAEKIEYQAH